MNHKGGGLLHVQFVDEAQQLRAEIDQLEGELQEKRSRLLVLARRRGTARSPSSTISGLKSYPRHNEEQRGALLTFFRHFFIGVMAICAAVAAGTFGTVTEHMASLLLSSATISCVYSFYSDVRRRWPLLSHTLEFQDSVYYLGFLLTLAALGFNMLVFSSSGKTAFSILAANGAALASTIAGLSLRVFMRRFRDECEVVHSGNLRESWGRHEDGTDSIKIHDPPGFRLLAFAGFIFTTKIYSEVLEPTIRDLQDEHIAALAQGRIGKARWVKLRGYFSFWSAVIALVPGSLLKRLMKIWKVMS